MGIPKKLGCLYTWRKREWTAGIKYSLCPKYNCLNLSRKGGVGTREREGVRHESKEALRQTHHKKEGVASVSVFRNAKVGVPSREREGQRGTPGEENKTTVGLL